MGEATAQAAEGMSAEDAEALEALRMVWGDEYSIGYEDAHGWWASRNGVTGHIITAASALELGVKLGEDYLAAATS
jgi:hypothetical protein